MKKAIKIVFKVILYTMAIIVGGYYGLAFIGALMNGIDGVMYFLDFILAIFLAYNINVIVHESGHLVFGLFTGYRFCSFRIWSFMLIKQDGKLNLRCFKLMGTGGQCLMIPPEHEETKASVILYNLGGIIFNLIFAILCFALNNILPKVYILSTFLWMSAVLSIFMLLTNGIPLNVGGIANDGMNALQLSKNPEAASSFKKQLLINAAQTEGLRLSEMPDEWFTLPDGADMQNTHNAALAVCAAGRLFDSGDIKAVEEATEALLNSDYNIVGLHRSLLTCDLVYCRLINDSGEVEGLLTPELAKFMSAMKNYPSVIRTEYTIALLKNSDVAKSEKILSQYEKIAHKFPYQQEIESERVLMTKALEKFKSEQ